MTTTTSSAALPGDGLQPDERRRLQLQEAGTSLAGRIAIGPGTVVLFRRGVGRLWPEIVEDAGFRLAIDGYFVHGGRFLLGDRCPPRASPASR